MQLFRSMTSRGKRLTMRTFSSIGELRRRPTNRDSDSDSSDCSGPVRVPSLTRQRSRMPSPATPPREPMRGRAQSLADLGGLSKVLQDAIGGDLSPTQRALGSPPGSPAPAVLRSNSLHTLSVASVTESDSLSQRPAGDSGELRLPTPARLAAPERQSTAGQLKHGGSSSCSVSSAALRQVFPETPQPCRPAAPPGGCMPPAIEQPIPPPEEEQSPCIPSPAIPPSCSSRATPPSPLGSPAAVRRITVHLASPGTPLGLGGEVRETDGQRKVVVIRWVSGPSAHAAGVCGISPPFVLRSVGAAPVGSLQQLQQQLTAFAEQGTTEIVLEVLPVSLPEESLPALAVLQATARSGTPTPPRAAQDDKRAQVDSPTTAGVRASSLLGAPWTRRASRQQRSLRTGRRTDSTGDNPARLRTAGSHLGDVPRRSSAGTAGSTTAESAGRRASSSPRLAPAAAAPAASPSPPPPQGGAALAAAAKALRAALGGDGPVAEREIHGALSAAVRSAAHWRELQSLYVAGTAQPAERLPEALARRLGRAALGEVRAALARIGISWESSPAPSCGLTVCRASAVAPGAGQPPRPRPQPAHYLEFVPPAEAAAVQGALCAGCGRDAAIAGVGFVRCRSCPGDPVRCQLCWRGALPRPWELPAPAQPESRQAPRAPRHLGPEPQQSVPPQPDSPPPPPQLRCQAARPCSSGQEPYFSYAPCTLELGGAGEWVNVTLDSGDATGERVSWRGQARKVGGEPCPTAGPCRGMPGFFVRTVSTKMVFHCDTAVERDSWVSWVHHRHPHTRLNSA
eukprot:TRINITY_DN64935_c0_g1_i1.p1 TRINITY_DN64935_c0_g1~~TRINITY_DN64935_c0_g1_i1.p1  ORF type:complete len:796 (+),score=107.56 TRINITY_DN64935_c0_g1_i1:95-2482(+)